MRYLEQGENWKTRKLWEEAFPEDSREFDDYYYRNKAERSRILAEEEEGEIISMVQLNPYRVQVRNREYKLSYIVGVATRADRRHQGHMRRLLIKMLTDMRRERVPFTFLMPAAEAIYLPFGFRYIFSQPHLGWKKSATAAMEEGETALTREEIRLGQAFPRETAASQESPAPESAASQKSPAAGQNRLRETAARLAAWQQRFLAERYEVFTVRDEAYVLGLMEELASEDGTWTVFKDGDGEIAAMESWWGLKEREQRFLYALDGLTEEIRPASPAIMARITCLEEFLTSISLTPQASEEQLLVRLTVKDPLIPENEGEFMWELERSASEVQKDEGKGCLSEADICPRNGAAPDLDLALGIEDLAQWLFGFKKPEGLPEKAEWIRPLKGVFLDEVV